MRAAAPGAVPTPDLAVDHGGVDADRGDVTGDTGEAAPVGVIADSDRRRARRGGGRLDGRADSGGTLRPPPDMMPDLTLNLVTAGVTSGISTRAPSVCPLQWGQPSGRPESEFPASGGGVGLSDARDVPYLLAVLRPALSRDRLRVTCLRAGIPECVFHPGGPRNLLGVHRLTRSLTLRYCHPSVHGPPLSLAGCRRIRAPRAKNRSLCPACRITTSAAPRPRAPTAGEVPMRTCGGRSSQPGYRLL